MKNDCKQSLEACFAPKQSRLIELTLTTDLISIGLGFESDLSNDSDFNLDLGIYGDFTRGLTQIFPVILNIMALAFTMCIFP